MPTYLYECPTHGEFEEYHSMSKMLEVCPHCQTEGVAEPPKLKRLINCSSKGVVELYGEELISKCKDDAKKIKDEASKDANKYASLLGEDKYHQLQTQLDRRSRKK